MNKLKCNDLTDGLIGDEDIAEIKCPVNCGDYASPQGALQGKHAVRKQGTFRDNPFHVSICVFKSSFLFSD
jgi:hypothetical protein